jgi:hypothetical protein
MENWLISDQLGRWRIYPPPNAIDLAHKFDESSFHPRRLPRCFARSVDRRWPDLAQAANRLNSNPEQLTVNHVLKARIAPNDVINIQESSLSQPLFRTATRRGHG